MMAILIEKRRRRRRKSTSQPDSNSTAKIPQPTLLEARLFSHDNIPPQQASQFGSGASPLAAGRPIRQHCKVRRSELLLPLLLICWALGSLVNLSLVAGASGQQQQRQSQQMQNLAFYGNMGQPVIVAPQSNGKGKYNTNTACEDRQLVIECDSGSTINLIRANFGRFSVTQCNEQGQLDLSTDCMSPITFRIMRERCQDKQRCSVNATSSIFGDRCPKTRKYLEVHYQCQLDQRAPASEEPERVNVRNLTVSSAASSPVSSMAPGSTILPPNNPPFSGQPSKQSSPPASLVDDQLANSVQRPPPQQLVPANLQPQHQQPMTVMNSEMLSYNSIAGASLAANEPIVVTLRHTHTENMSNARCVLWDQTANQWTERGSKVLDSNQTHTVCAFDQATSYLLVMDYLAPYQTPIATQSSVPQIGPPFPNMLDLQPVLLDSAGAKTSSISNGQAAASSSPIVKFFSLFGYLLAFVFMAVTVMTIAFVVSSMRSSAGAALKSLGNFAAFSGPKYKGARSNGRSLDGSTGLNKDLLVINSQSGHQFLYAPAQSTKISSSASTHILTGAHQNGATLHHQQQHHQPLYSTNGTLSNLSGTGAQSNNYYGLTGLAPYFQQQSQLHFASQYQPSGQQHQLSQLQQTMQPAGYHHQANKSTISNESANSSPSSSGVESGSTSVQQQQQQQFSQQQCLMMNNDYNLMNQLAGYGQHQSQLMQQQQQPTLTLNAHYSGAGLGAQLGSPLSQLQRNQTLQREHIYECVDDQEKPSYAAHLLLPADLAANEHQFNSNTLSAAHQHQQQVASSGSRTLSSRMFQQQVNQQQQQQNKRLFSHPAIVRDNQPTKTNIICSKLAQVTPQRATEIQSQTNSASKFQQDIMAIYNGTETSTVTSGSTNNYTTNLLARKLSTDC